MIANLMRWARAILVPPLIMALIVRATEEGSVELLVLFVVGTVAFGTLPLALAQWEPATRAVVIIA